MFHLSVQVRHKIKPHPNLMKDMERTRTHTWYSTASNHTDRKTHTRP